MGHAHRIALSLLLVPALLLSWWEAENHQADVRMSQAASALAGRPVYVTCQRLTGAFVDAGAELGYVRGGPDGQPVDETVLTYDTCQSLYACLCSDKQDPARREDGRGHVLAHASDHRAVRNDQETADCCPCQ